MTRLNAYSKACYVGAAALSVPAGVRLLLLNLMSIQSLVVHPYTVILLPLFFALPLSAAAISCYAGLHLRRLANTAIPDARKENALTWCRCLVTACFVLAPALAAIAYWLDPKHLADNTVFFLSGAYGGGSSGAGRMIAFTALPVIAAGAWALWVDCQVEAETDDRDRPS